MTLVNEHPVEYPNGTAPLSEDDAGRLGSMVPGWTRGDGRLTRSYDFADFNESFGFVARVALLAEAEGHHPDVFVSWSRVELTFWTHTAGGLTRNDFIMAAKVDKL